MVRIARGRRHHQAATGQRAQGLKIWAERADLLLAGELQQELGAGRQGLQRLATDRRRIGLIQNERRRGNAREIEPDPLPFAPGQQLAAAGLETNDLILSHRPRLPQHMGRRQGAVTAEIHFQLGGEPAQLVAGPAQRHQKGGLRLVELGRHGQQGGIRLAWPQRHHRRVAAKGVPAEGIDMKQADDRHSRFLCG